MTIRIKIVSGILTHDTQLLGQMVYDQRRFRRDSLVGQGILKIRKLLTKPCTTVTELVDLLFDNKPAGTLLLQLFYEDGMKFVGNAAFKSFNVGSSIIRNTEILTSENASTAQIPISKLNSLYDTTKYQIKAFNQIDDASIRYISKGTANSDAQRLILRKDSIRSKSNTAKQESIKPLSSEIKGNHQIVNYIKVENSRWNLFNCCDAESCNQIQIKDFYFVSQTGRGPNHSYSNK